MKRFVLATAALCLLCACHVVDIKYRQEARRAGTPIRDLVEALFTAYEMENVFDFEHYISKEFRDASGNAANEVWVSQAVRDDFRNLDNPMFEVFVESVQFYEVNTVCRVKIRWYRRATVPFGGEEWIVRDQDSALLLKLEEGAWKLWRIEGDPLFGISDSFGAIRVDRGTMNGVVPGPDARIENGKYAS